jgi:excisionase family DNA binding protein
MVSNKAQAEKVLSSAPDDAKIDIDQPTQGKTMITVTVTKDDLIKQKFSHLVGNPITVTEAAEYYNIPRNTILEWVTKGYVVVICPGYKMTIDNSTMAYCAEAYHSRKNAGFGFSGSAPLLDQNGLPVQLKNPKLAAYRSAYRRNRKN